MTDSPAQLVPVAKRPDASRITGFIDAITTDRIFGWAWDPQRAEARIAIRVEVEGKPMTSVLADQPREDLAGNGVGDGAHAFEIVLAPNTTPEKIRVFALGAESGDAIELTHRPLEGALVTDGRSEELRGVVHAVCRSQRLLSGKVQATLDAIEMLKKDVTAKPIDGSVTSRLDALEVAVARIDGMVREHKGLIDALEKRPQDQISRVIAYAAVALAGIAVVISLTW